MTIKEEILKNTYCGNYGNEIIEEGEILTEGMISPETFGFYLWNKCLKTQVKKHSDNLYSVPNTVNLAAMANYASKNPSWIPTSGLADFKKKAIAKVVACAKKSGIKLDVSTGVIDRAIEQFRKADPASKGMNAFRKIS